MSIQPTEQIPEHWLRPVLPLHKVVISFEKSSNLPFRVELEDPDGVRTLYAQCETLAAVFDNSDRRKLTARLTGTSLPVGY